MSGPAPIPDPDLALIADGLCDLFERRPEVWLAILRQLARRSPPPLPLSIRDREPERGPFREIRVTLEAIYLPQYRHLDKTLWHARLKDLKAAHQALVSKIHKRVLKDALAEARANSPLLPVSNLPEVSMKHLEHGDTQH